MRSQLQVAREEIAKRELGRTREFAVSRPPAEVGEHDAQDGSRQLTGWCPTCRERAVPMRNGSCGFCETPLKDLPDPAPVAATTIEPAPPPEPPTLPAAAPGVLHMGPDLELPLDAATQSLAILAVKGAGKSNAAAVLAEEMFDEGIPWVVIDPKGDWWGVREAVDGSRGLPVPVLGGPHGDLPLSAYSGRQVATLIVERNLTCVLDVSWMDDDDRPQFLADLGQSLFDLHHHSPSVRHVIVEEANEVLPQSGGTREMKRAWTRIVCQGRQRGLGITLVSQRSALVNKNVLTQTGSLLVLRTTSPQDRQVIRGWVDFHSVSKELVDSLPGLANGEAWIVAPSWLDRVERVRLRRRWTFDSGATPMVVSSRRPQMNVDLAELERLLSPGGQATADPDGDADADSDADPQTDSGDPRELILDELRDGPRRRAELLDATGLSPSVLYRVLHELADEDLVEMNGAGRSARWRIPGADPVEQEPPVSTAPATIAGHVVAARRTAEETLIVIDDLLSSDAEVMLRARYLAALLNAIERGDTRPEMLDRFERIAGLG